MATISFPPEMLQEPLVRFNPYSNKVGLPSGVTFHVEGLEGFLTYRQDLELQVNEWLVVTPFEDELYFRFTTHQVAEQQAVPEPGSVFLLVLAAVFSIGLRYRWKGVR